MSRTTVGRGDTAPRPPARRLADLLRAADPGLARTRSTLRALLAATAGGGLALLALQLTSRTTGPAAIAVTVGLLGVLTLPPGPPAAWGPAAVVVVITTSTLSAVLQPGPAGYTVAMVVTVAAAWASRFGPVGVSVGFLGFIASLLSLRIGYGPSDIVGLILVVPCGVAGVLITVRVLVPDRPAATARRLRRSLLAQLSVLVDAVERLAEAGPGRRRQRRARLRLVAVQETALALDRALTAGTDATTDDATVTALRGAVLDVEALADHLLWSVLTIDPDASSERRATIAGTVRRERHERDDDDNPTDPLIPRLVGPDDRFDEIVQRLSAAARRVRLEPVRLAATPTRPPTSASAPSGRLTVKTALTVIPTMLVGLQIAESEWYWGVIAAYIVVTTTASRVEGIRKAAERLVGTAVGVLAGLGIAYLLQGRGTITLAALIGVLAIMVWVFQVNYTLFTFALTIAIALLYEVTGVLTTEVLALRVAETAVGVAIAGVVVTLVLPVSGRRKVDVAVAQLLTELDGVLADVQADRPLDPARVRDLDDAVSAVREATAPFVTGLPLASSADGRAARLLATALRVRVGALGTATRGQGVDQTGQAVIAPLRARLAVLRDHVDPDRQRDARSEPLDRTPLPRGEGEVGNVLRTIDDRLAGYGTARGVHLRDDPGALAAGTGRFTD